MRPVVFSIKKYEKVLSTETTQILVKLRPKGIIIRSDNVDFGSEGYDSEFFGAAGYDNLKELISDIINLYKKERLPRPSIFIDGEGGAVNRVRNIGGAEFKGAGYFSNKYKDDPEKAKKELYDQFSKMGAMLKDLGITHNLAPVVDLDCASLASKNYGSRAYGEKPAQVIELAKCVINGLIAQNITPVLKHALGLAPLGEVDTHLNVATSDISKEELLQKDLYVFKELCDYIRRLGRQPMVMVNHGVYTGISEEKVSAVVNLKVLQYLKANLGDVTLITDDICMKGLFSEGDALDKVMECLQKVPGYLPLVCKPQELFSDPENDKVSSEKLDKFCKALDNVFVKSEEQKED